MRDGGVAGGGVPFLFPVIVSLRGSAADDVANSKDTDASDGRVPW